MSVAFCWMFENTALFLINYTSIDK